MGEIIKLGAKDAALVFKGNGEYELYLPKQGEKETALYSSLNAVRCAYFLDNEEMVSQVDEKIKEGLTHTSPPDLEGPPKCNKCLVPMKPGKAIESTLVEGIPDFPGGDPWGDGQTLHYGGPGKMMICWKCPRCGYSTSMEGRR